MDSLLASYLSSDEEEDKQHPHKEIPKPSHTFSSLSLPQPKSSSTSLSLLPPKSSTPSLPSLPQPKSTTTTTFSSLPESKPSPIFPSLPQPKFSSHFSSLPQPTSSSSSSIFSSLPPPTLDNPQTPLNPTSSFDSKPKRVVQFRPPIILKPPTDEDDEDEDEEKQRKPIKEPVSSGSSLNSFFSSLPAPKNTLGSGSAPLLGAGRRSVVETDVPTVNRDQLESEGAQESHVGNFNEEATPVSTAEEPISTGGDSASWNAGNENYGSYGYYEENGNYGGHEGNYGSYDGGSAIASTTYMPESSGLIDNMPKMLGKRGRKEIPSDIVEVKQDELMKNRPREDQIKSTGIAFGPSYQPASTKGKPSKLHKRKHQIGSLYYDMRQKEHELAERRSKGFLTKAETQAKYGW